MANGNEVNLARFRIEQARECLDMAEKTVDSSLKNSVNRSYYCIFHAMRAILAFDKFDSKKHSGIISEFRRRYIKSDVFPKRFSDILRKAFQIRNESDYEDFYVVAESEAREQIKNAKEFLEAVEKHIASIMEENP